MPKKLNVHPNERIDIPDFDRAASGYTQDALNFHRQEVYATRRAEFIRGFRIELPTQTSFPGQITVHNGTVIDRDGELYTEEALYDDSRSITLVGANLAFYIEIEFTEEDSDVDDRAIWDPTFDTGSGGSLGKEFNSNVTTRTSPTWKIVSPVSTSGFESTTDPTSTKVPLAILQTNTSGEIDVASNPGLATSTARSVLEEPATAGDTQARVVEGRLFPDTGTLDIGGDAVTISGIDKRRGIIYFTGTPLGSSHATGTIVSHTSVGAPEFIQERTTTALSAAEEVAATSTHPDKRRMLYLGDEVRGAALLSSKETSGERDETQLSTLKDRVDALAALFLEMKTGKIQAGSSIAVPNYGQDPVAERYYNTTVGSLQGARTAHFSICDGVNSLFGDFVGTDHQPFQDAIDAAIAQGVTNLYLHVRAGTYDFTSTVNASNSLDSLIIVGEEGGQFGGVSIGTTSGVSGQHCFGLGALSFVSFKNIQLDMTNPAGTAYYLYCTGLTYPTIRVTDCKSSIGLGDALIRTDGGTAPLRVELENCDFSASGGGSYFLNLGFITNLTGYMKNVQVGPTLFGISIFTGTLGGSGDGDSFVFEDCTFLPGLIFFAPVRVEVMENVSFHRCKFTISENELAIDVETTTVTSSNITFQDCTFLGNDADFDTGFIIFRGFVQNFYMNNCTFDVTNGGAFVDEYINFTNGVDGLALTNTSFSHVGTAIDAMVRIAGSVCHDIKVDNCKFILNGLGGTNYAILLDTAGIGSCDITNNTMNGISNPVRAVLAAPADEFDRSPRLNISHNSISWEDPSAAQTTSSVQGIWITNDVTEKVVDLVIENNMLYGIGSTGDITGIQVTCVPGSFSSVRIDKNTLSRFEGFSNTSEVYGVRIANTGTASFANVFIRDNLITDLVSDTLSNQGNIMGVRVEGTFNNRPPVITGNKITNLGQVMPPNSTAQVAGIYCEGTVFTSDRAIVSDNQLIDIGSGNIISPGFVLGIELLGETSDGWLVENNRVYTARANTAGSIPFFRGINIAGTGNKNASIHNNDVRSCHCIIVNPGTAIPDTIMVSNNRVNCQEIGIAVFNNELVTVGGMVSITGNIARGGRAGENTLFIQVFDVGEKLAQVAISENTVRETVVTATPCVGIFAYGPEVLTITGNSVITEATTHVGSVSRAGIYISQTTFATVTGNTCSWNPNDGDCVSGQAEIFAIATSTSTPESVVNVTANVLRGGQINRESIHFTNIAKYLADTNIYFDQFLGFGASAIRSTGSTGSPAAGFSFSGNAGQNNENIT